MNFKWMSFAVVIAIAIMGSAVSAAADSDDEAQMTEEDHIRLKRCNMNCNSAQNNGPTFCNFVCKRMIRGVAIDDAVEELTEMPESPAEFELSEEERVTDEEFSRIKRGCTSICNAVSNGGTAICNSVCTSRMIRQVAIGNAVSTGGGAAIANAVSRGKRETATDEEVEEEHIRRVRTCNLNCNAAQNNGPTFCNFICNRMIRDVAIDDAASRGKRQVFENRVYPGATPSSSIHFGPDGQVHIRNVSPSLRAKRGTGSNCQCVCTSGSPSGSSASMSNTIVTPGRCTASNSGTTFSNVNGVSRVERMTCRNEC